MAHEPKREWEVGAAGPHPLVPNWEGITLNPTILPMWPNEWPSPRPVLSDGSEPRAYALLAGWIGENVWGWHALVGLFSTKEDALAKASECKKGEWWQVVHLFTGEIIEEGGL